jgi:hypothetical protein
MNERFKRLANSLNWKPIETLPWIKHDDWPWFSLPIGLVIRRETGGVVVIGTNLEEQTNGCGCCSDNYSVYGENGKYEPRLPWTDATNWAWLNEELGR